MDTVIFACVHNAGRSQMAAAWFNALCDSTRARAISAGTEPGRRVHPEVLEAMREVGIDLADRKPQTLTDDLTREASMLVTMGCGEQCPLVPGLRRDDWPLEDPKGKPLARVREIRNEVRSRVVALLNANGWSAAMIRAAKHEDRASVEALLTSAGLPLDGVAEHFATFFVVDNGARIVGAAGMEIHGVDVLLRSVVVADEVRGGGFGSALTRRVLDEARVRGVRAIYLLTTTAEGFFPRFAFERIAREKVPPALRASREFQSACPSTATVMRLRVS